MPYYVSIGHPELSLMAKEETASKLNPLPFGIDTLEEAHTVIAISKSPVWTIRLSEGTDDMWQEKDEIDCSPMVRRTRELNRLEQDKRAKNKREDIERIKSQPSIVTRIYEGITVTFTRRAMREDESIYRYADSGVSISIGDTAIWPYRFITGDGRVQKKKWREDWDIKRAGLASLADHLKEIQAVAQSLGRGTFSA